MTMFYTPRDEKILAEKYDEKIKEYFGRKPETEEERDRLWRLIVDAARC
jgi:hypothetical protein